jgi:putative N6-adenine-specific DNA methylase
LYKFKFKALKDKTNRAISVLLQKDFKITLKTFFGLEEVLKEELHELGYRDVQVLNRAVQIKGDWEDVYRLNLHLRCAISVLVTIAEFRIREEKDLYKNCLKIKWTDLFSVDKTFAVKGAVFSNLFKHSQFPFLLVKDAVADTFREELDDRPNVNVKTPQVLFDLYIREDQVTISLNTSGSPLFQRGYRESTGEAPLNEVVAAGLIRLSGWDRKSPFIDPFCGSGTLLIEAAFLATGLPSNIERQHYAFRNFKNFDRELWEKIHQDAKRNVSGLPCVIKGGDISDEMILKTRRNLRALPFGRFVETTSGPFEQFKVPEGSGIMVTNPPYGVRMGDDIAELYERIGSWMKHSLPGYSCWILSSSEEGFKTIGLKPEKKIRVYNGELECSFRKFSVYEGSKKADRT